YEDLTPHCQYCCRDRAPVPIPAVSPQPHHASLAGWHAKRRRITVNLLRAGENPAGEVSTLLHDSTLPGDTIMVSAPAGDVTLPKGDHPLVLVSAGIGCTPMVAMLHRLVETARERQVLVLHADHTPEEHA